MNEKLREIKLKTNNMLSRDPQTLMYRKYKILIVNLPSIGCKYGKQGFCTMCTNEMNISKKNVTIEDIEKIWDNIKENLKNPQIDKILLSTYGNILSKDEISLESLGYLLEKINENDQIKVVIFETYYKEITEEKLKYLKQKLNNKYIDFEVGIESVNQEVQQLSLNKEINLEEVKEKINLIHKYDMRIEANVLIGIPFLTTEMQITDVKNTINWLVNNKIDEIVLFPVNIIPNSTIEFLYKNKEYQIISHWLVIKVLDNIPENFLDRISISMFGEYKTSETTIFNKNILPKTCLKCNDVIMEFYHNFLEIRNPKQRKKLIKDLINTKLKCECNRL